MGLSIKSTLFFKKNPWYYDFDGLHGDRPTVNLLGLIGLIEPDQSTRRNGKEVKDEVIGGYLK